MTYESRMENEESETSRRTRLHTLFNKLDVNKNGLLDRRSLSAGLKKINHPLQNADDLLDQVLAKADTNRDGLISWEEFLRFIEATEQELWNLFCRIDRDSNGKLDLSEIAAAFERSNIYVDPKALHDFFSHMDRNNDQVIDFDEWRDFLLFLPLGSSPSLSSIYSYFVVAIKVTSEGDGRFYICSTHNSDLPRRVF